jgi:hypothetical protein
MWRLAKSPQSYNGTEVAPSSRDRRGKTVNKCNTEEKVLYDRADSHDNQHS